MRRPEADPFSNLSRRRCSQDVHARYRTDSHASLKPRFNERFLLSLSSSASSLFLDDELNVLPVSAGKDIVPGSLVASKKGKEKAAGELERVRDEVSGAKIVGELVGLAKTVDQVREGATSALARDCARAAEPAHSPHATPC